MLENLERIDRNLFLQINSYHSPFLDKMMWSLSSSIPTVTLILIFAYFFYKKIGEKKLFWLVFGCILVFTCTDSSSTFAKKTFKRYRPTHNLEIKHLVKKVNYYEGGTYGFFSGHSANTFGLAFFIFLCARWMKPAVKLLFFTYPLLVVYSRIYLGVHYPSDAFMGMLDGFFFGGLIFYFFNKYFFKFNENKITTA